VATTNPVLNASGIVAGYKGKTILHGLDLHIQPGETYALLGANGAGKTTTLSLFLGFVVPVSGNVRVADIDPALDATQARRKLAYIPENVALYEYLSARENVAYLLDLAQQSVGREAIDSALTAAGLDAAAFDQRVGGFSKGMRQKVAIALALARKVPALLLDEPNQRVQPLAGRAAQTGCGDFDGHARFAQRRRCGRPHRLFG